MKKRPTRPSMNFSQDRYIFLESLYFTTLRSSFSSSSFARETRDARTHIGNSIRINRTKLYLSFDLQKLIEK